MPKGDIAGTVSGDDGNHSLIKTQKLEETIVEVPELDLQGCTLPGDEPWVKVSKTPSDSEESTAAIGKNVLYLWK